MLFEAWVRRLASERLGLTGQSGGSSGSNDIRTATIGDHNGDHFVLHVLGLDIVDVTYAGVSEEDVQSIIIDASAMVATANTDEPVVYQTELRLRPLDFVGGFLQFMRILGDQVHIEGSRRLSDVAILDFEQGLLADAPAGGLLLAPPSKARLTIYAAGPGPSDWSQRAAAGIAEVVAAVCALATGRPVDYGVPYFAANDDDAAAAMERMRDESILTLARDYVSLDVFGELTELGGDDAVLRVRGALLAYHAAMQQTSPDVAVMLFVTAIEALISPRPEWGKQKVTTRYSKSLIDLCPTAVDAVVNHDNVEQAFEYRKRGGVNRQRRDLLERIYETRSLPTHTGLGLCATGIFAMMADQGSIRVALLSDLARAAILSYIQSPRSSLIGHPGIDPPASSANSPSP